MRPRWSVPTLFLATTLICAIAPGCRDELGPEQIPTAQVSGVVLMSGKPLGKGWVEFQPTEGARGNVRSARIDPDGSFHADRVPIGLNVVRLIDVPISPPGAARLFSQASPIRRSIPARQERPIQIDVFEELLRYQGSRTPTGKPPVREEKDAP